ncbi:hypothetical protein BO78DRAFT_434779 [Aspergillus sclerotiicarbonarius CBS 121057]|uniref:Leucine-rich repeat domain-containing protein n=1 Tax=Aspergillus sclerotiicarbonarius (strain CBS 121057 / IBT 28362) TaxID=1448318 RepID=A0A319EVG2_ASPSB|nr:hypothetical protein BO78DRAFT_434779 [Aspergillus sclerotiicarbonarius CBS 121057]
MTCPRSAPTMLCSSIKKLSARDLKTGDCTLRRSIELLWRRPDLTRSVRHFEIERSVSCAYVENNYNSDSEEENGGNILIKKIVDEICDTDLEKKWWSSHLQSSCEGAWLAVLLTRLTHLERLSISNIKPGFLLDVLVKAAKRQRPFGNNPFPFLRDVELTCPQENETIWSAYAMPFFYLPAVRKISALKVYEGFPTSYTEPDFASYKRSECQVTEINLFHTIACYRMNEWIAACSKLESFHLEFGVINSIKHTNGYNALKASSFRESLLPAKHTLTTLHLEFDVSYKSHSRHLTNQSKDNLPFGSFKEFYVLEHLFMRHANLVRLPNAAPVERHSPNHEPLIEILPKSLKSLAITEIMDEFFPALISDLVELVIRREDMPHLGSIVLHVDNEGGAANKSLIEVVKLQCVTIGQFSILTLYLGWVVY